MVCAYEIAVIFFVVRAVQKFDYRLVINETPDKLCQYREVRAVLVTHILTGSVDFAPIAVRNLCRSTACS